MEARGWAEIVRAAIDVAHENNQEIADVSLDAIARRAGISRATLYRRIGNRDRLDAAIRAAGFDPGGRGDVRERAIVATAEIISDAGFSAYNLEAVAARANCSVQALHSQVGGRDALLTATFERFSPLPRIEEAFANRPASLEEGVRRIYTIAFDALSERPRLLAAFLADALGRNDGRTAEYLLTIYLPRAFGVIGGWLAGLRADGRIRPLPVPMLIQLLIPPIMAHAPTRDLAAQLYNESNLPREAAIEELTQAYVRAVGLPGDDHTG